MATDSPKIDAQKAEHPGFLEDIAPLLSREVGATFKFADALTLIWKEFLPLLSGEPWSPPKKKGKGA